MQLKYKLWLDYRGRAFGDGPARLLAGVEEHGSLRKAAQELGMSYNKAWRIIHAAEQRLGFPLLDRSVGGSLGGGSQHHARGPGSHEALSGGGRRGGRGVDRWSSSATSPTGGPGTRPTSTASEPAE